MSSNSNQQPQQTKPARQPATVARGRTVDVPYGEPTTIGVTAEGKEVKRLATKSFGPGQTVHLPADEIAGLRKLGYLVDPDAVAPASGAGPMFGGDNEGRVGAA